MSDDWNKEMTDKMSKEEKKVYGDYRTKERAECDVRTLMEGAEIKADSERMKMAMHCARVKRDEMKSIIKED